MFFTSERKIDKVPFFVLSGWDVFGLPAADEAREMILL